VPPPTPVAADRDLRTVDFVAWLADHSAASFRETYDAVAARAHDLDAAPAATGHARGHALARVGRSDVAAALDAYYDASHPGGECHLYRARVGDEHLALSVVVRPSWLSAPVSLIDSERATFRPTTPGDGTVQLGPVEWRAAVARLAEVEVAGTVMVNNPLYRLRAVDLDGGGLATTFTLADFASYALTTADLLESELLDALADDAAELPDRLPLRQRYLPTLTAANDLDERSCVGGVAALIAIARPARAGRRADYVLLVQERSSRVLNVAGKLAVIPKAFHQPTGEPANEVRIAATVERELEEELFGREDLEQRSGESVRRADPLHAQHRSEPMADLLDHRGDTFRTECTGFGINLVTGNYEFPCLIVIEDERWWDSYGHLVEANWETMRVHRYSSLDTAGLAALAGDPRWSNEGLFAFLEGLRQLAETDTTGRVAAPPIDVETG
jgi:hypothetical protein